MDRQTNFLFGWVLLLLFILAAQPVEQLRILLGILLSVGVVLIVFFLGFLSLDALVPAVITGVIAYGLGDVSSVVILGVFFISGSLLTLVNDHRGRKAEPDGLPQSRRNGKQAWSNAWWFCAFLIVAFLFDSPALQIAAVSALATATADTWATELGLLPRNHKTVSIIGFRPVPQGMDGGVSLYGTVAAILGSALIGAVYMLFSYDNSFWYFFIITLSGFFGCLADSVLGALFQHRQTSLNRRSAFFENAGIGNNKVNWLSTGLGGLTSIILYGIFFERLV